MLFFLLLLFIHFFSNFSCKIKQRLNQGILYHRWNERHFETLFRKTNDFIADLTISFTSGVSLQDTPCY